MLSSILWRLEGDRERERERHRDLECRGAVRRGRRETCRWGEAGLRLRLRLRHRDDDISLN